MTQILAPCLGEMCCCWQEWLEADLSEAMRPVGRSAKLEQGWSHWFCALNKQAALSYSKCSSFTASYLPMFQEIWFSDTEVVLAFLCNGLPGKKRNGEFFRQKSLALLHSDTAFQHYYLLDTMRSDFKMLVTSDYKEQ